MTPKMHKSGVFIDFSVFYLPLFLRGVRRVGVFDVFYVNPVSKSVIFVILEIPLGQMNSKSVIFGVLSKPGYIKIVKNTDFHGFSRIQTRKNHI